jgi:hypothetical protein
MKQVSSNRSSAQRDRAARDPEMGADHQTDIWMVRHGLDLLAITNTTWQRKKAADYQRPSS